MKRRHQDGSQLLGPCVWGDSGAITGVGKMGGWGVLNKEVFFFDHNDFEACVRHAGRDI